MLYLGDRFFHVVNFSLFVQGDSARIWLFHHKNQ